MTSYYRFLDVRSAASSGDRIIAEAAGDALGEILSDEEFLEEFEPNDFDDSLDDWGLYEAQCAGCDLWTRVDDLMLCEDCAAKLDRDMIRCRDWDYSSTAWPCPKNQREKLRSQVIREHGAELELIAPPLGSEKSVDSGKTRQRRRSRRKRLGVDRDRSEAGGRMEILRPLRSVRECCPERP